MAADQSSGLVGQTVGARLRAARRAKKYTQGQLAAPDFSVSFISAIERGQIQPSSRALAMLACRLEVPSMDLLAGHAPQQHASDAVGYLTKNEEAIIDVMLLEAQISIVQGKAAQAIASLKQLGNQDLPERERLRQHYLLGWAYLLTLQFQKCEHTLAAAQQLAQAQSNSYISLHISNLLGQAYTAMHNPQCALQSHQGCLQLLEQTAAYDPFFKCRIYNHLGLQHLELNDISSAITLFQQALALAEELATPAQVQAMYGTICKHYSEAAEFTLATLYYHKSALLDGSHTGGVPRSEIYLLTATDKNAAEACQLAQPFGDTLIAVETHIIWGRIQYAMARYEAGDEHFGAGLEMSERLQMTDELSEQLAQYAQLLAERDKAQEAITYYRRAFESRRAKGHHTHGIRIS